MGCSFSSPLADRYSRDPQVLPADSAHRRPSLFSHGIHRRADERSSPLRHRVSGRLTPGELLAYSFSSAWQETPLVVVSVATRRQCCVEAGPKCITANCAGFVFFFSSTPFRLNPQHPVEFLLHVCFWLMSPRVSLSSLYVV